MSPFDRSLTSRRGADDEGLMFVPLAFVREALARVARAAWTHERVRAGGLLGLAWRAVRVLYLAVRGFYADHCLIRASALTYVTALSLVPLLAFAFSLAKGLGFYERLLEQSIRPWLDQTFGALPSDPAAAAGAGSSVRSAIDQVLRFVDQTDVSALGAFGGFLLVFTVLKLLSSIESSFNDIWGVHRSRSLMRMVSDYVTMVVVTPLFLFTATAVTTAAHGQGLVPYLREELGLSWLLDLSVRLTPLFALWLGFSFVYLVLPNTRVRFGPALVGGVLAGTLWQGTLLLHLRFQIGIANYNAFYSSFAALPIFLIWLQVSWVVVLLGAEVCAAIQSEPSHVHVSRSRPDDHAFREIVGLRAVTRIAAAFLAGRPGRDPESLARDLEVPQRALDEVLGVLCDRGVLVVAEPPGGAVYLPARDPSQTTVKDVLDALRGTTGPVDLPSAGPVDDELDRILEGLDAERTESRHNRTLRDLGEAALAAETRGAAAGARAGAGDEGARARSGDPRTV